MNFNHIAETRKIAVISILFLLVLIACGHKKSIVGTWHSVRLENKDIDSFYIKTQQYIKCFMNMI